VAVSCAIDALPVTHNTAAITINDLFMTSERAAYMSLFRRVDFLRCASLGCRHGSTFQIGNGSRATSFHVYRRGQAAAGKQDVYYSRAWWPTGGWSAPRNLGDAVNTPGVEQRATLSADGKRLYFGREGDIYLSTRSGRN
jgi:hypothetical protein